MASVVTAIRAQGDPIGRGELFARKLRSSEGTLLERIDTERRQ